MIPAEKGVRSTFQTVVQLLLVLNQEKVLSGVPERDSDSTGLTAPARTLRERLLKPCLIRLYWNLSEITLASIPSTLSSRFAVPRPASDRGNRLFT